MERQRVQFRLSAIALAIGLAACFLCSLASLAQVAHEDELKALVQQAFALHEKGQFAQAIPLLERVYKLSPNDYFVNLLLGIDSLRTGYPKRAVPYLQRAARQRPKEDYPLSYLGEAYARQELYGLAAESHLRAIAVAPHSAEPSIAFVDFALSRFADLSTTLRSSVRGLAAEYRLRALATPESDPVHLSLLKRAADLDPSAPGIWSDLGRAEFVSGDISAARDDLTRALHDDPEDLSAKILDALVSARSGDWRLATTVLNAVASSSPEVLSSEAKRWPKDLLPPQQSSSGASSQFFACVREGKLSCTIARRENSSNSSADQLFRQQKWGQLVRRPAPSATEKRAWRQRGIAFAHIGECGRAITALERGIVEASSETYGMFLLSWCYSREAGRAAEQVQQSAENEAPLHLMRGDILLRLQAKANLAVDEYQRALQLSPGDPSILERLAEAQFGAGKTDAARENAQAALKVDPQRLGAKRTLAKIALQDRDYQTAVPLLRELAARNPNDVTGLVELGKACAQTGALQDARDYLAPALERGYPDEKGTLHYLLGTVLKKMGKNAEADQAFAKATELSQAFQQKSYRDQDPDAQP